MFFFKEEIKTVHWNKVLYYKKQVLLSPHYSGNVNKKLDTKVISVRFSLNTFQHLNVIRCTFCLV